VTTNGDEPGASFEIDLPVATEPPPEETFA
jgi:hypothetical protein